MLCQELLDYPPDEYRFYSKVNLLTESGCWEWGGEPDNGYGRFSLNNISTLAHRQVLMFSERWIPAGLQVDHLCRNRGCVNPGHLDLVTIRENVLRGAGVTARNARATACPEGHQYDLDNTYITPSGARNCKTCRRESVRNWRARQKEGQK